MKGTALERNDMLKTLKETRSHLSRRRSRRHQNGRTAPTSEPGGQDTREIIRWLESPEGEDWSSNRANDNSANCTLAGLPSVPLPGVLVCIKDDELESMVAMLWYR
jgi:hypothetical protein